MDKTEAQKDFEFLVNILLLLTRALDRYAEYTNRELHISLKRVLELLMEDKLNKENKNV